MKREPKLSISFVLSLLIVNILTVEAEYCDDEVNNLLTAKLETSDNKLNAITEAARIELQKIPPAHLTDCARDLFMKLVDLAIFDGGSTIECTNDETTILHKVHDAMRKHLLTYEILEIDSTNTVIYPIVSLQRRFMKKCFKEIEQQLTNSVINEPTRLLVKMFEQFMQISSKIGDLSYLGVVSGLVDNTRAIVHPQKTIELWAKMMRGLFDTKYELEKKLTSDESFKAVGWNIGEKSLFDELIDDCKKDIGMCPTTIKELYTDLILNPCKYLLSSYSRVKLLEEVASVAAVSYWPTENNLKLEFPIDESVLGPLTLGHRVCRIVKTNGSLCNDLCRNSAQFIFAFTEDLYQLDFGRTILDDYYTEAIDTLDNFSDESESFFDNIEKAKHRSSGTMQSNRVKERIFSKLSALMPLVEVAPNDFECSDKEIEIIQDVTDVILVHSVDDLISVSNDRHPSAFIAELQRQFGRKCFKDIATKLKSFAYENELSKAVLMPRFWELTSLNNQMDWIPNLETCLGLAASISNLREIISTEKQRLSTMMKNSLQDLCNGPLRGVPRSLFKFWQSPRDLTLRNFFYLDQDAGVRRLRTGISDEKLYEEFILGWCNLFKDSANAIIEEVERAIKIASSLLWPKYGHASFIDTESTDHEAMFLLGQFTLGYSVCKHIENPELSKIQVPSHVEDEESITEKPPKKKLKKFKLIKDLLQETL